MRAIFSQKARCNRLHCAHAWLCTTNYLSAILKKKLHSNPCGYLYLLLVSYKMGRGYYGCKKTESEGIARGHGLFMAIISEATFITNLFPTCQCHNNSVQQN